MRNKKGQFIKGHGFWKGKKRPGLKTKSQFQKGFTPWNKGKKFPRLQGKNNASWKEKGIGYTGIHAWVVRRKGKANHCEKCGLKKVPPNIKRYFHWANKSGKYKRNLNDWMQLCWPCHIRYDRERNSWGKATKLWNKNI